MVPVRVTVRTSARIATWLAAASLAAAQAYAALSRPFPDRLADLHVYVGSVQSLRGGRGLYDFAVPGGAPFTYPPFAGLVMMPLGLVGERMLRVIWTVLTIVAVCWLAALTARWVTVAWLPAELTAPIVAAVLFASAPISSNLRFGQVSVLLALLVVADLAGTRQGGAASSRGTAPPDSTAPRGGRWSGGLTGVAAAIKLTPLIFVPYLFLAGRRRAAALASAAFLGCLAVTWAVLPEESRLYWLNDLWDVQRVGHIGTRGNQSLNGALLRVDMPPGVRTHLFVAGAVVVAVVAIRRAVLASWAGSWFTAVTIVGAASVVVSPVSWTHHLVWLVLAAFLPVSSRPRYRLMWTVFVVLVMVVPITSYGAHLPGVLGLLGGNLRLLLAIAIACAVPFESPAQSPIHAQALDRRPRQRSFSLPHPSSNPTDTSAGRTTR